jgi:hypothetical protein
MLAEQLNLHLVDQVVDNHFFLLEMLKSHHHSCLFVNRRVNLTILPLS